MAKYRENDLGICEECNRVIKLQFDGMGVLTWMHLVDGAGNHDAVKVEL